MVTDRTPVLTLVPSPLLGPAVWEPVAAVLRERGWDVLVPPVPAAVSGPDEVLDHLLRAVPADRPIVLVPHSNAGLYAAALVARRDVAAVVFVDAGLPSDEPTTPTAPAAFRDLLGTLVEPDGLLPVWTRWWPEAEVAALFPDAATRAAVEAGQARLQLAYFDATVPSPPGWRSRPAAYLEFGSSYDDERAAAERSGWPVTRLEGGHLHMVVDPEGVADALVGLLDRLGLPTTT